METALPTICVAIPTYLREEVLVATVEQVLSQNPAPDEVLIIDQSPAHLPATQRFLSQGHEHARFRWIRQDVPSLTKARNRALLESESDAVLYIDDDVVIPPGFVGAHAASMSRRNARAVCGPVLDSATEPLTHAKPKDLSKTAALGFPGTSGEYIEGLPYLRGGNHSVQRRAAIAAGGYDENFVGAANGEETDLAFRLHDLGALIIHDPTAWLVHLRSPIGGCRIPRNNHWAEWEKTVSILLFLARHGPEIEQAAVRNLWATALRAGPLRRENVLLFWRQPYAWASVLYASFVAHKCAKRGVQSPFVECPRSANSD